MGKIARNKKGEVRVTLSQRSFAKRWDIPIELGLGRNKPDCTKIERRPKTTVAPTTTNPVAVVAIVDVVFVFVVSVVIVVVFVPRARPALRHATRTKPTAQTTMVRFTLCHAFRHVTFSADTILFVRVEIGKEHVTAQDKKAFRAFVKTIYKGPLDLSEIIIRVSGSKCSCPDFKVGQDYIIMGSARFGKRGVYRLVMNKDSLAEEWYYAFNNEVSALRQCDLPATTVPVAMTTVTSAPVTLTPKCGACRESENPGAHFCISQHVILARITKIRSNKQRTVYYADVLAAYKGRLSEPAEMLIRVPGGKCPCPPLRVGENYVLMGSMRTTSKGKTRMRLTPKNFVREWSLEFNSKVEDYKRKCGIPVPSVPTPAINRPAFCKKCQPSRIQDFCFSKNVFRVRVVKASPQDSSLYKALAITSYKGDLATTPLLSLRVPSGQCACPELTSGRDYVIMGQIKRLKEDIPIVIVNKRSYVTLWDASLETVMGVMREKCGAATNIRELVLHPTSFIDFPVTERKSLLETSSSSDMTKERREYDIIEMDSGFKKKSLKGPHSTLTPKVLKVKITGRDHNATSHVTQYHASVKFVFKLRMPINLKLHLWVYNDTCNCPELQVGELYLIMGNIVHEGRGSSTPRLMLSRDSFVRRWKQGLRARIESLKKACASEER
ncbi:predicted protein [Nematostella vectensis]|uniref:NTR domain-containing protein n=1 Tax=Nematostella vectensis TaxID=45351 RepID=A7SX91_NEMVE|nr:predicted protein [Nematostella vectensis]|eukprot:XP_001623755.1 predicted protein [Nematostella vectensis]